MEDRTLDESEESETQETKENDVSLDFDTEGMSDEQIAAVKKLGKKAKDFDGLVERQKAAKSEQKKSEEKKTEDKVPKEEIDEDKLEKALERRNEKSVLKKVVEEGHPMYIPELVEDKSFSQIIQFLPRNVDRSSEDSIHKALKRAVKLWKDENGIEEKTDKSEKKKVVAELAKTEGSGGSGSPAKETKPSGRKILQSNSRGIDTWYPKKD